ncbi:hypothetical protein B9479_007709 [Cryptococcus floricola]|uniref:Zn(2)-C6 fungal-type domain-containing protein n=1 Tax=Cryptococcus floricola TaxID=2591691 RepID=A0A5D3APV8_9TREE|nr:hypothetical protein B9479_007709 [Cryptococcus floricola]
MVKRNKSKNTKSAKIGTGTKRGTRKAISCDYCRKNRRGCKGATPFGTKPCTQCIDNNNRCCQWSAASNGLTQAVYDSILPENREGLVVVNPSATKRRRRRDDDQTRQAELRQDAREASCSTSNPREASQDVIEPIEDSEASFELDQHVAYPAPVEWLVSSSLEDDDYSRYSSDYDLELTTEGLEVGHSWELARALPTQPLYEDASLDQYQGQYTNTRLDRRPEEAPEIGVLLSVQRYSSSRIHNQQTILDDQIDPCLRGEVYH